MKRFMYDEEECTFGIMDEEKFKVLKFNVYKCTITGNKAVLYCDSGTMTYKLLEDGTYEIEAIN